MTIVNIIVYIALIVFIGAGIAFLSFMVGLMFFSKRKNIIVLKWVVIFAYMLLLVFVTLND